MTTIFSWTTVDKGQSPKKEGGGDPFWKGIPIPSLEITRDYSSGGETKNHCRTTAGRPFYCASTAFCRWIPRPPQSRFGSSFLETRLLNPHLKNVRILMPALESNSKMAEKKVFFSFSCLKTLNQRGVTNTKLLYRPPSENHGTQYNLYIQVCFSSFLQPLSCDLLTEG